MRNAHATMSPRSCFTSSIVPATVPPVARRSSTMRTFAPGCRASLCISSVADPYSRSYSTDTTSAGSFPSLRTGTKPTPSLFSFGASPTGQRIIRYKGARFFGVTAPMTDVGKRLEDMDRVGIDVEVLSLSTPNVFFAEGRAQIEVARMVNDAYADLIAKRPGP